jgi:hypothetical protein
MPGILRCGALDFTSPTIVDNVINAVKKIARNRTNIFKLDTDGYGFNIPEHLNIQTQLNEVDISNMEKFINIYRGLIFDKKRGLGY